MKVSIIVTVKDEQNSIIAFLDSLKNQTKKPNEVVIVDGGSSDRTVEYIQNFTVDAFAIKLITGENINRPEGRNIAIVNARSPIIACTDAGNILDEKWLENITRPFEQDPNVDVVTGVSVAKPKTVFEQCNAYAMITDKTDEDVTGWFERLHRRVYARRFAKDMPSSRSIALKKEIWKRVGGYPEHLNGGEDTLFHRKMKRAGAVFALAKDARVYWSPRSSVRAFLYQNFEYSRADGKAGMFIGRHLVRFGAYIGGIALFIAGFYNPWFWLALLFLAFIYLAEPVVHVFMRSKNPLVILEVPVVFVMKDAAQMYGFLNGLILRILRKEIT